MKVVCDIRDQEIRTISEEEIKLCKHYKSYNDVRSKYPLTDYKYNSKIIPKEGT
jgi:hypothetical protein